MEGRGKPPSYRDITSATDHHTSAFIASLAKTANSLLIVTQELRLHRTCNKVWTGATFLKKRVSNLDDPSQIEVDEDRSSKDFSRGLDHNHDRSSQDFLGRP